MCKAAPYLQGVAVCASVNTLAAIALDRYVVQAQTATPKQVESQLRRASVLVRCCFTFTETKSVLVVQRCFTSTGTKRVLALESQS